MVETHVFQIVELMVGDAIGALGYERIELYEAFRTLGIFKPVFAIGC